ncbi:MAG: ATP-binding cassette domain-containing protein [Acidobacteriota bacterium]
MSEGANQAVAAFRDVTVRYGRTTAAAGISLEVHRGSVYALLGRNGAGKSSLVRCLLGQQRPTAGTAHLFGRDAWRSRAAAMARLGVVPEECDLPPAMDARGLVAVAIPLLPWLRPADAAEMRDAAAITFAVAFGLAVWTALRTLWIGLAITAMARTAIPGGLLVLVALLAAGLAQTASGRTDIRRTHRALSLRRGVRVGRHRRAQIDGLAEAGEGREPEVRQREWDGQDDPMHATAQAGVVPREGEELAPGVDLGAIEDLGEHLVAVEIEGDSVPEGA